MGKTGFTTGTNGKQQQVRVVIRVRPLLEHDAIDGVMPSESVSTTLRRPKEIRVGVRERSRKQQPSSGGSDIAPRSVEHTFTFDSVCGPEASQEDVFEAAHVNHTIAKVMEGYNATVFAYGQTGSGKTFTINGEPNRRKCDEHSGGAVGLAQRAVTLLFERVEAAVSSRRRCRPSAGISSGMESRDDEEMGEESNTVTLEKLHDEVDETDDTERNDNGDSLAVETKTATSSLCEDNHPSNRQSVCGETCSGAREPCPFSFRVMCSFKQIYKEQVFDLLSDQPQSALRVRWGADRDFYVSNLTVKECATASETLSWFKRGSKRRVVASHNMNSASSRSHSIFTLSVERTDLRNDGETTTSTLHLVDLAGSERATQTGATGDRKLMTESIGINTSLFALRNVIKALAKSKRSGGGGGGGHRRPSSTSSSSSNSSSTHIPYRDSLLTRLLKSSLGGSCITTMIACVCPSELQAEESLSTLKYASLAKAITNRAVVNEDAKSRIIRQLREEVAFLREQLARAQQVYRFDGGAHVQVGDVHVGDGRQRKRQYGPQGTIAVRSQTSLLPQTTTSSIIPSSSSSSSSALVVAPPTSQPPTSHGDQLEGKLVDSVEMIKALLEDNNALRLAFTEGEKTKQEYQFKSSMLEEENLALYEQLQFLQSVVVGEEDDLQIGADVVVSSEKTRNIENRMLKLERENKELKALVEEAQIRMKDASTAATLRITETNKRRPKKKATANNQSTPYMLQSSTTTSSRPSKSRSRKGGVAVARRGGGSTGLDTASKDDNTPRSIVSLYSDNAKTKPTATKSSNRRLSDRRLSGQRTSSSSSSSYEAITPSSRPNPPPPPPSTRRTAWGGSGRTREGLLGSSAKWQLPHQHSAVDNSFKSTKAVTAELYLRSLYD